MRHGTVLVVEAVTVSKTDAFEQKSRSLHRCFAKSIKPDKSRFAKSNSFAKLTNLLKSTVLLSLMKRPGHYIVVYESARTDESADALS